MENGFPEEIIELDLFFYSLSRADKKFEKSVWRGGQESVRKGIEVVFAHWNEKYTFLNVDRCFKNVIGFADECYKQNIDDEVIDHLPTEIEMHLGKLREYYFWRDDVLKFKKKHEKIGILAGDFHTEFFVKLLEGKKIEPPLKYDEWRKTIPTRVQIGLKKLERMIGLK